MAVTCRKEVAPAFFAATATATTASWSIARKAAWLPACLIVVPRAENASSTAGSSGTSGRTVWSWVSFGLRAPTSLRPTVTTLSHESSARSRRSKCPPTRPVAPARRAVRTAPAYGNPVEQGVRRWPDSSHGPADPSRDPVARLLPGRDGGVPRGGPRRRGQHARMGLHALGRDLGERGRLRGVRPGDDRGGAPAARCGLRVPDELVVDRPGRVRRSH